MSVDVAGMCAVQCDDGCGGQQQDMQRAFQCQLCDILACCSDCPSSQTDTPQRDGNLSLAMTVTQAAVAAVVVAAVAEQWS
jgi:hypothetical protein